MLLPKWAECTYCGDSATTLDHVTPISWKVAQRKGNRRGKRHGLSSKEDTVPCCFSCNSLLGNKVFFEGITEKARYIGEKLSIKYRKILAYPYWSSEELDSLEPNLRQSVKALQTRRAIILNRILWANTVTQMKDLNVETVWSLQNIGRSLIETK